MSGHSKWANIKNRKGAQDKKRSEAFTKVSKNILTAIRAGGGNTNMESNSSLRLAIDKAREANMPKDNIDRLLKAFESRKANLARYMFEGYGPFGVPLMIDVETDNKNRSLGEIKFLMKEYEASLGEEGCVAFQFKKMGEIETEGVPEEKQLELIDLGVEDMDGEFLYVAPTELHEVVKKVEAMGLKVINAQLVMRSISPIALESEEQVGKILDLVEALEENDDVVQVFTGFNY